MSRFRLLLVEDEPNLGETLRDYLRSKNFQVELAMNCAEARKIFSTISADVVLMDIGLPDGSGMELAREFRAHNKEIMLLFLSALNDPATRLEGLEVGAEDYITKPFELKELTLRLERCLRTKDAGLARPEEWRFGNLRFWPRRFEVQDAQGCIIALSQKESGILTYLLDHQGQVVSRDELIEKIWGEDSFPTNRTVDNMMVKLRRWCESDQVQPIKIISVRGVGYRLDVEGA